MCVLRCVYVALMWGYMLCFFLWRHAAEQQPAAADRPEVCWCQLWHWLWRLPHLHRPPGEHVQYVETQRCIKVELMGENLFVPTDTFICQPGIFKALDTNKRGRVRMNIMQVNDDRWPEFCSLMFWVSQSCLSSCVITWQFLMLSMNVWGNADSDQEPSEEPYTAVQLRLPGAQFCHHSDHFCANDVLTQWIKFKFADLVFWKNMGWFIFLLSEWLEMHFK